MPRYIDADALIDFLDVGHLRHPSELCFSEVDVANLLLHAPTISPDDVRGVGEWKYDHWCEFKCSICGEWSKTNPRGKEKFCPSCGARMKGADGSE